MSPAPHRNVTPQSRNESIPPFIFLEKSSHALDGHIVLMVAVRSGAVNRAGRVDLDAIHHPPDTLVSDSQAHRTMTPPSPHRLSLLHGLSEESPLFPPPIRTRADPLLHVDHPFHAVGHIRLALLFLHSSPHRALLVGICTRRRASQSCSGTLPPSIDSHAYGRCGRCPTRPRGGAGNRKKEQDHER